MDMQAKLIIDMKGKKTRIVNSKVMFAENAGVAAYIVACLANKPYICVFFF